MSIARVIGKLFGFFKRFTHDGNLLAIIFWCVGHFFDEARRDI